MGSYENRYKNFTINGAALSVPFVKIPEKGTDKFVVYKTGKSRLDKISDDKYGVPYYGYLILAANPEYGGFEFDIPDNSLIRVPFPLEQSKSDYNLALKQKVDYYGQ